MRHVCRWLALAIVVASVAGCASKGYAPPPPIDPDHSEVEPFYNWPAHPNELERRLIEREFEVRRVEGAGGGVTGAQKVTLYFPADDTEVAVKWKLVPRGLDGWNNSPRKELAAYEIQKWFLDPEEYIVPTTTMQCRPMNLIRDPSIKPTVDGTNCVLFALAVWLNNVTVPDKLYDEQRFQTDARYARHMANFNVLAILIDHRDGRQGNFLVSKNEADRRVYAVDNGISFNAWIWNYFVDNWEDAHVPALPKTTVDRLRRLTDADYEKLGVIVEMRLDENGVFQQVPPGPNLNPRRGARLGEGVVQLGLTKSEIDEVRDNVEDLLEDVDDGDLAVF
jgi:predicted small lipoprotein YifL